MALAYGVADQEISRLQNLFKAKSTRSRRIYSAYYYEVTNLVGQRDSHQWTSGEQIRKKGFAAISGANAFHGVPASPPSMKAKSTGLLHFDEACETEPFTW